MASGGRAARRLAASGAQVALGRAPENGEIVSYGNTKLPGNIHEDRQGVSQGREKAGVHGFSPWTQRGTRERGGGGGGGGRRERGLNVLEGSLCEILGFEGW